ncbi:TrlF family AAA-like ATPase [Rothia dentocariosa]|uniref:TrlF family AAA-like ATPase n=1 Tax=Rothia dentocariosa TaxID=2047 RepID=UPI0028E34E50|nr:hypothetical protein [Rothia dentocariosa]
MNTRGSEWKKWDLHVHAPDTKMNNGYKIKDIPLEYINSINKEYENYYRGEPREPLKDEDIIWFYWIHIIHNSDVHVIGVTDYFSLDSYFTAKKYYHQYLRIYKQDKNTKKILFPNMELRASHAFNKEFQHANIHLIFEPNISPNQKGKIINNIPVNSGCDKKYLIDLNNSNVKDVTINIDKVIQKLEEIFGKNYKYSVRIVSSGNDDGISTKGLNIPRNNTIRDKYVELTDGIFTMNEKSVDYWPKNHGMPTFGGSDAHSFPNLEKKLGKQGEEYKEDGKLADSWNTTWIKADTDFEGFKQVFIEPEDRVKIQEQEPDVKSNYAWIKEVQFEEPRFFPESIELNQNLNSIIGSRSSGKSALLGYISQAVGYIPEGKPELAAGISWEKAKDMKCSVLWADGDKTTHELNKGQKSVIYIPQNHLFNIASDPERVTLTIQKTLYTVHSESKEKIDLFDRKEKQYREDIRRILDKYFGLVAEIKDLQSQKKEYPALSTLEEEYRIQESELTELRRQNQLSEEESKLFNTLKERIDKINNEKSKYSNYSLAPQPIVDKSGILTSVRIPDNSNPNMKREIDNYLRDISDTISIEVAQVYDKYNKINKDYINKLKNKLKEIEANAKNRDIIKKSVATPVLSNKDNKLSELKTIIAIVNTFEQNINNIKSNIDKQLDLLVQKVRESNDIIDKSFGGFDISWKLKKAEIYPIVGYKNEYFENIESCINKRSLPRIREYTENNQARTLIEGISSGEDGSTIKLFIESILEDPRKFLESQRKFENGIVTFKGYKGKENPLHCFMEDILVSPREVRLFAEYEDDRIGGYEKSTMTPGKQAIFALELILADSGSKWPLLIDQPEDDLDSRSIYDSVVSTLRSLKKERQIIMVTHDANLVIGSDSEEVIVVNRNGADRPNANGQFFNYATGSLENTKKKEDIGDTLSSQGIREHCCEILDGGEEAFQKRQSKYNI